MIGEAAGMSGRFRTYWFSCARPARAYFFPLFQGAVMAKKMLAALGIVMALLSGCTLSRETGTAAAPDFKLHDLNGKTVQLSDFKGKPVLIDFWATWCPPCREAIPALVRLHKAYGGKGLVVLGISLDQGGWDSVRQFVQDNGIGYAVLKGNDAVQDAYQVRTIPMVVLLNKEGRIVKRYIGVGGDDELDRAVQSLL
jgi:thiol-disulfide isomerase/thioredoxin